MNAVRELEDMGTIAVVTDVHRVAHAAGMFAFLMPDLVKVSSNEERIDVEKWVAA